MFGYLLLVILFLSTLVYRWKYRHITKLSKQLKSDIKALPILGHAYLLGGRVKIMDEIQRFGREANKHGGLTYLRTFNVFFVVITDPEVIDVVSKQCLEKHQAMKNIIEPALGNGSLIAPVPIWRPRRKFVSQTFRQTILNQFVNKIFCKQSTIMTERLSDVVGTGTFSIYKYFTTYTFDSVFEAILGVQLKAQHNPDLPYLKSFEKGCELVADRAFRPWLHITTIYELLPEYKTMKKHAKVLTDLIDQIIASKRKELEIKENNKKQRSSLENLVTDDKEDNQGKLKPFLELLLEHVEGERPLTDLECREELLVLALAATDTSGVGSSFMAVMLSRHPEVQEKVYQELREVFGESDRLVEAADLPRLKYLQAVIKETLRLYPPAPISIRTAEKDVSLPSGMILPKGVGVFIHIWGANRNPQYWGEDADVFRPERFLESPLKHPAAFMSFSFGPRNCPGHKYAMMSMTTLMATLLRKYQLLPATSVYGGAFPDAHFKPLRIKYDVMIKDVDGFQVQIKSRT